MRVSCLSPLCVWLFFFSATAKAWQGPLDRVRHDFLALTRRVTARHILLPSEQVAVALRQRMRQVCLEEQRRQLSQDDDNDGKSHYPFVGDVFASAARKYSRDIRTAPNGGLVGELVAQGHGRCPAVLDQACFSVPVGEIVGPIASSEGWHLLLVYERTNCPQLDGRHTKLVPCNHHGLGQVIPSPRQEGQVDVTTLVRDQALFWVGTLVAGGLVAELSANLANSF